VGAQDDIRAFLASRRARITPDQAGLTAYGRNRRVPGLRREEVAMLAGISVEYYTQLERGNARGASDDVLAGIADALQLDDDERNHLMDIVRAAQATSRPQRRRSADRVRPGMQGVLDAITGAAAFVRNQRLDILSTNTLGAALYSEAFVDPIRPANLARFIFLDARSTDFYVDWNRIADDTVGSLRVEAGRNPYERALTDLIGELSTRSEDFRTRWAAHNVRAYRTGQQRFRHPLAGELTLNYEALDVTADPTQTMIVYTPPTDSPAQDALQLLGSWASTHPVESGPTHA
jgi:transcriptional regulator with XRE-family HTH domain